MARLVDHPDRPRRTRLRVFGYPVGRSRGQWTEVRVVGPVGDGLLQVNTVDGWLPAVRAGYSGSPVHDPATGEVIGMVARAPREGHDSLIIPTRRLRAFRPDVARVEWWSRPGGQARPERRTPRRRS